MPVLDIETVVRTRAECGARLPANGRVPIQHSLFVHFCQALLPRQCALWQVPQRHLHTELKQLVGARQHVPQAELQPQLAHPRPPRLDACVEGVAEVPGWARRKNSTRRGEERLQESPLLAGGAHASHAFNNDDSRDTLTPFYCHSPRLQHIHHPPPDYAVH